MNMVITIRVHYEWFSQTWWSAFDLIQKSPPVRPKKPWWDGEWQWRQWRWQNWWLRWRWQLFWSNGMRSDRRRWYSVRCSGVPFLKYTIWPFPLPTSVLLPIFIRGPALRIQIRRHALCPSHFKTTLYIAPLFSVNIFMREVLCPKTKELTFLRMFVCICVCVSTFTKSFSISICV